MHHSSKPTTRKPFQTLALKLLFGGLILLIYFSAWRPLRITVAEQVVYPQLKSFQTEGRYQMKLKAGSILFHYSYDDIIKKLQYRPGFGFFFLITLLALLVINTDPKYYLLLIVLHFTASLLAWLGLLLGAASTSIGFVLTDIVTAYLAPALSLAIVPFALRDFGYEDFS